jgi:hypothetical protein
MRGVVVGGWPVLSCRVFLSSSNVASALSLRFARGRVRCWRQDRFNGWFETIGPKRFTVGSPVNLAIGIPRFKSFGARAVATAPRRPRDSHQDS